MTLRTITTSLGTLLESTAITIARAVMRRPYLSLLAVFAFFTIVFVIIYLPNTILSTGDDHFFHFRFAYEMRQHGFFETFKNFKGIYWSKIQEGIYYPYYNFLFYLVIIPFTYITPLYLGIKLYAIFAAALSFTVLYAALRSFKVPYAFFWSVALFAAMSVDSLWRLLLSRPYTLAPVFLLLLVLTLQRKKYIWSGVLAFAYLYWYSATFFFPLMLAGVYYVFETLYEGVGSWRSFAAVALGTFLSMLSVYLIAPGFLGYIWDIVLLPVIGIHEHVVIPEGGELYAIDIFDFVHKNAMLFVGLIIALVAECFAYAHFKWGDYTASQVRDEFLPMRGTLLFLGMAFLGGSALLSGRFEDYIFLFFGLYLPLAFTSIARKVSLGERTTGIAIGGGIILALLYLFIANTLTLKVSLAESGTPAETFEGVGTYLADHAVPGQIVFNADWSWFPQLYYWSPDTNYVTGLASRYLYAYSPQLYWEWSSIVRYGVSCDTIDCIAALGVQAAPLAHADTAAWYKSNGDSVAQVIAHDFHATYVVSAAPYSALNNVLDNNSHFKKVYGKGDYYVYQVLP